MTRARTACVLVLISPLALAASTSSYILPAAKGALLLHQCSRGSPSDVKGYFRPEPSQVAELEERLSSYLKRVRPAIQFQQYNRQYVGFMKGGTRYIYGNFFKAEFGTKNPASEPVVVCDGGDWFWSIVYSLDTRTFQEIQFNGIA
jgi:hypothetical protein